MKSEIAQVSQEVVHAVIKGLPPITATIVVRHNIDWSALVSMATLVYTMLLIATTVLRNWGMWRHWFSHLKQTALKIYAWLLSRWHAR